MDIKIALFIFWHTFFIVHPVSKLLLVPLLVLSCGLPFASLKPWLLIFLVAVVFFICCVNCVQTSKSGFILLWDASCAPYWLEILPPATQLEHLP